MALFVGTLPLWLSTSQLNLATIIVIFGIVAASLVLLSGWAGQVSLGQMAFVGVGAFVGGALTDHRNWDLALADAGGGPRGRRGRRHRRLPGTAPARLTLAVSTLAFGLFVSEFLLNRTIPFLRDRLPGRRIERGTLLGIELSSEQAMFYACLFVLVLGLIMVVGVRRSRTGRVLIAIRENEKAARAYGVNATRTSLAAFALSGFLAAVAGALYVHQQTGLSAEPFSVAASLELFTMVVIGGLGSLPGALLGATYVHSVDFYLPPEWQFLATGVGLLLVLLVFPSGFGGVLADLRDGALRKIATRRGMVVPSLLADVRVEEVADAPPEETVLAAAGEIAVLAEAEDAESERAETAGTAIDEPGEPEDRAVVPTADGTDPPRVDAARSNNGAPPVDAAPSDAGDDTVEEVHQ